MKTLTGISGGIDSAAALYLMLERDGVSPESVYCYHLRNIRRATTASADAEWAAFNAIQIWFNSFYPGINWRPGAVIDWRQWPVPLGASQFHALIRGSMAQRLGCSRILIAGVADDWNEDNEPEPRFTEHDAILRAMMPEAEVVEPLREMRKAEVMEIIPDDLLALTWSCSDAYRKDNHIYRCGGSPAPSPCTECLLVRNALPCGGLDMRWFDSGIAG